MSRGGFRLTAKQIERAREPGVYQDGAGLRLVVRKTGSRYWVLRVMVDGKSKEFGIGSYPAVSLEEARDRAQSKRKEAKSCKGRAEPDGALESLPGRPGTPPDRVTFRQAFQVYFDQKEKQLGNAKHLDQWRSTMRDYVFPVIGDRPASLVTSAEVLEVLTPIWNEKPETSRRILQRMKSVFDSAVLRGWREKASPCVGVAEVLGKRRPKVKSHRALPWRDVPRFVQELRACSSAYETRLALEWLILTAARSAEARGARWEEIDVSAATWTIPATRMKMAETHIVPLAPRCLEILVELKARGNRSVLLFPSPIGCELSYNAFEKPLENCGVAEVATTHGFRSSFRDWVADNNIARSEVAEAALAHTVANRVEAAYRRTRFLEERRALMNLWAAYAASCTVANMNLDPKVKAA